MGWAVPVRVIVVRVIAAAEALGARLTCTPARSAAPAPALVLS